MRCCLTRDLDPSLRDLAADYAVMENAENHALGVKSLFLPAGERAAAVTASRWATGRKLRVKLLGGDAAARDEVLTACAQWSLYANIDFALVGSDDAEIRVAFQPGSGSWSYVGTDCLAVPKGQPTMNLGWPNDLARTLHEFGHALGLIHEHQNPLASIPWNFPAVIAFYGGPPNNWPIDVITSQVLAPERRALTNGGYDRDSIMEYAIPPELVTDPAYAVGWNQRLSDKDKQFIAGIYPGRWTPPGAGGPGTPSGPTAEGGPRYKVHVPAAGDYFITLSPAKPGE